MPQPRHTETSILQSYLLPPSPLPTILPYSSFLQLVPAQHRSHPHLKRLYRDLQFQRNVDVNTVRENIDREVARSASLKADLARRIANEHGENQTRPKSAAGNDVNSKKRKRLSTNLQDDEGGEQPTQSLDNNTENRDASSNGNPDGSANSVDTALDTTYYTTSLHPSHPSSASRSHPLTSGVSNLSGLGKYHTAASLISSMNTAVSDIDSEIADLEAESDQLLDEIKEIVGSLSDLRYGRFARPTSNGDTNGRGDGVVENEIMDALGGLEEVMRKVV